MSAVKQWTLTLASRRVFEGFSSWSDALGMIASIGCAIHCAAMPFVIASLPALGLGFLADEAFHLWMAVICIGLALAAFIPGWRKHRRLLPAMVGMVGLTLICGTSFGMAGDCCASCKVAPTASAPTASAAKASALITSEAGEDCTDACCKHCALEKAKSEMGKSTVELVSLQNAAKVGPAPVSSFSSYVARWLTPIGGLILITAHLLNRRFGCLCGCCKDDSPRVSREGLLPISPVS